MDPWTSISMARYSTVAKGRVSTVDEISEDDPEVKKSSVSCSTKTSEAHSMTDLILAKYSVWLDLRKTVAWLLHYKCWLQLKAKKDQACIEQARRGKLLVEDLQETEECIIRCVQQKCYENEMILTEDRVKSLRKSSPLRNLDPILNYDLL